MTAAFHPAISLGILLAIIAPFAMALVGIVSLISHPLFTPQSAGGWVIWLCRGVAYVMSAILGGMLAIDALLGRTPKSALVAVIIAIALLTIHMKRERHRGTGDPDAT